MSALLTDKHVMGMYDYISFKCVLDIPMFSTFIKLTYLIHPMTGRSPFVNMVQPMVGYHNLSSISASVGSFPGARFGLNVKEDEHTNKHEIALRQMLSPTVHYNQ